jgi:hypothetical protein
MSRVAGGRRLDARPILCVARRCHRENQQRNGMLAGSPALTRFRDRPPRENGPIFSLVLVSSQIGRHAELCSASRRAARTWTKILSVSLICFSPAVDKWDLRAEKRIDKIDNLDEIGIVGYLRLFKIAIMTGMGNGVNLMRIPDNSITSITRVARHRTIEDSNPNGPLSVTARSYLEGRTGLTRAS